MADLITTREQWLARRQKGIGGSDAAVVLLGRVYGRSAADLARAKRGEIVEDDSPGEDLRRGNALEDDAVAEFELATGREVWAPADDDERWNGFWFDHPAVPYAYANLDGLLVPEDGGRPALLDLVKLRRAEPVEVKCPRSANWYEIRDSGLPAHYQIQAQHQMWVTGAPRVHFWIFNSDAWRGLYIVLERDEAIIAALAAAVAAFWRAVESGVDPAPPPEVAIVRVAGERSALDVSTSDDWRALFALYREVNERAEASGGERDRLRDLIGDLVTGLGVDTVRCGEAKALRVVRKGAERLDKKRLAAAHPEIDLRAFSSTGAPSESLTIEFNRRARGARGKGVTK
jgi:putative phage-type endonuclease